ncbi:MAG: glycosyltransferase family 1 protein [Saprospiraceae bacterium]
MCYLCSASKDTKGGQHQDKMKIGLNGRFLLKGRMEGIGWFCHEVIRRMVKQHQEHEFYIFFDRDFDPEFIFEKNVHGIKIGWPARHPILWYAWFEFALPRALKKFEIDLFISMDGYCSLSTTIPQYLVMHDLAFVHYPEQLNFWARKYYKNFVPKFLKKAHHVFAVSNATKQDIIKQFQISPEKIEVCYSGVKDNFKKLSDEEIVQVRNKYTSGNPYFLFVGALHPRKNVHGLIKAFDLFKSLNENAIKLVIVGRKAWMTNEIEYAYQHAKYKDEIQFLEDIDNEELALITAAAYAAVAPSFLEGFGVPAAEALVCGIPVLCSNQFSLPEIAGPGAILFDPNRSESIADAMLAIVNDKNLQERIDLGFKHKELFSWDKTTEVIGNRIFGK